MSDNNQFNHPDLFRDLSELEQEKITAGENINVPGESSVFLQKTDIQSYAENNMNLTSFGDLSTQKTGYRFSQITFGANIKFGLPYPPTSQNILPEFFANFLSNLFS